MPGSPWIALDLLESTYADDLARLTILSHPETESALVPVLSRRLEELLSRRLAGGHRVRCVPIGPRVPVQGNPRVAVTRNRWTKRQASGLDDRSERHTQILLQVVRNISGRFPVRADQPEDP